MLIQIVLVAVPPINAIVASGFTVIDPDVVALAQSPSARIVNVKVPVSDGVPEMV